MKLQQIYLHPYCQPDIKHMSQLKTECLLPLRESWLYCPTSHCCT